MMTLAVHSRVASTQGPGAVETANKLRTLIVDDQQLAREVLRRMLKNEPDIEIVGTPANGTEAVEAIGQLKPDLVFLDVQMPELDGFGVLSKIEPSQRPAVIFVTANHEFAHKAFDVQALDYMVKPCSRDRMQVALQRARDEIRRKQSTQVQTAAPTEAPAAPVSPLPTETATDVPNDSRQPDRMVIKSNGRILFLNLSDIDWIEAADNYVQLHVGTDCHRLRETMSALEAKLPADRFVRISRSSIVNIRQIKEMHSILHGEYAVVLQNGTRLTLTRSYRDKLRQLGLS